jgi:hypothetical protein
MKSATVYYRNTAVVADEQSPAFSLNGGRYVLGAFVTMVSYRVSTHINEDEVIYWLKRASDPNFARGEAVKEFNRRMEAAGKTERAAYTPPALPPGQRRIK